MSASFMAYFAATVLAIEALVMSNLWALGIGLFFALIGIYFERKSQ